MDEDSWVFVPAQVKGGHVVRMALDLSDIVAVWPTPDGVMLRHTNGGATRVMMRAAEVAELLGLGDLLIPDDWFEGVGS